MAPPEMNNQLTQQLTGKVLFRNIQKRLAAADEELVRVSHCSLHQAPVSHPPVPGDGVEVKIVVQVIRRPADLPALCLSLDYQ